MEEIWRPVIGYEDLYEVSNHGRVKSLEREVKHGNIFITRKGKILKPSNVGKGYLRVGLYQEGISRTGLIHRLVLNSFVGESILQCNHKDGDKHNNKLYNLEWVTSSYNNIHKFKSLGYVNHYMKNPPYNGKYGANHFASKKVNQYSKEGVFIKQWGSLTEASISVSVGVSAITQACKGNTKTSGGFIWKYL